MAELRPTASLANPASATFMSEPKGPVAPAPGDQAQYGKSVPEDTIRLHALWNWTLAGKPEGQDLTFWLEPEQQLLQLQDWTLAGKPEGEDLKSWSEAERQLLQSK